jgi:hypothetical protein
MCEQGGCRPVLYENLNISELALPGVRPEENSLFSMWWRYAALFSAIQCYSVAETTSQNAVQFNLLFKSEFIVPFCDVCSFLCAVYSCSWNSIRINQSIMHLPKRMAQVLWPWERDSVFRMEFRTLDSSRMCRWQPCYIKIPALTRLISFLDERHMVQLNC